MQRRVDIGPGIVLEAVAVVAEALADEAHAAADAETLREAVLHRVVEPGRCRVLRARGQRVALGAGHALDDLHVEIGIGQGQVQPVGEARRRFDFEAAAAQLVELHLHAGREIGARLQEDALLLLDLVDRRRHQQIDVRHLILDAQLVLLGRRRHEGRAVRVQADIGREGRRVAGIGRNAVVEEVADADAAGEGIVALVLRIAEIAGGAGRRLGLHPVVARAQRDGQAIDLDDVLQIQAELALGLLLGDRVVRAGDAAAVVEAGKVQGRRGAVAFLVGELGVVAVDAAGHGVPQDAGVELGLELGVGDAAVQRLRHDARAAGKHPVHRRPIRVEILAVDIHALVAGLLAEGEDVGQALLELVADAALGLVEIVEVRIGIGHVGHVPVALDIGGGAAGVDPLQLAENGEAGVGIRRIGDRRRDQQLVVRHERVVGVRIAGDAGHPVEGRARPAKRPRGVEGRLVAVVGAVFGADLAEALRRRPLRRQVDDAAGIGRAVKTR